MTETMDVERRFVDLLEPTLPGTLLLPDDWDSVLGTSLRPTHKPYKDWSDPYIQNEFAVMHYGGQGPYSAAIAPFTLDKTISKVIQWELMHTGGSRNWRGLAYAGAFDEEGNVLVARGFHMYGAHRGDFDGDGISANKEGMPWLWVGGERNLGPSQDALDAFELIVIAAEAAENTRYTRIIGHKEIQGGTSCPGTRGMAYLERHRTSETFRSKWNGTPLPPEPGSVWEAFPTLRKFDGWKTNVDLRPFVRNMQALLANNGWKSANTFNSKCQADGQFGNGTLGALRGFKAARGLSGDECGPDTWQALNNL